MSVTVTGTKRHLDLNSSTLTTTGNVTVGGDLVPASDGGGSLGKGSGTNLRWNGIELQSGAGIQWQNGDARIIEGLVNNYSLSFQTYDGSSMSTALRLDGNNTATFAGNITVGDSHFIGDDADDNLLIQSSSGENLRIDGNGRVLLQDGGSTKLETSADGISVTGDIAVTGTVDGVDIAALAAANTGDQDLSGYVATSGNQTITGVKTFDTIVINDTDSTRGIFRNDAAYDLRLGGGVDKDDGAYISLSGGTRGGGTSTAKGRVEIFAGGDNYTAQSQITGDIVIGAHWSGGDQTILHLDSSNSEATFSGVLNATKLNTGQGDYELYAMNQDVETTDAVTFNGVTSNGDILANTHVYGRYVNNSYSLLYRFGGLFLTWDSDSYGTNFNHSITSTDNGTYSDSITINSFDKVRINIDSNNNDSASTFSIGKHGTGTSGTLLTLEEDGDLTVTGDVISNGTVLTGAPDLSSYAPLASPTFTGTVTVPDLTVTGNLSITGDINSYNVTDLDVVDKTITIGKGQTEANSGGSGIIVDGSAASLLWDESDNRWEFNKNILASNFSGSSSGNNTGDQDLSGLMPKSGGTFTGSVTGTQFKLNNNVGNTNADSFLVYDNGGSVVYGMTLWNTNATSGEWATMIFGPNQSNRRISFGKANSNFGTNHAGIDELAWLDLDNGNYFTDGNMYPSNQTTHYVSSGRIQNWQTAYTYSQVGHLPLSGGTMTGNLIMEDEMIDFANNGDPELPNFKGKRSSTRLNDRQWDIEGGWSYTTFENNTTDRPSDGLHNANGLLTFNTHSGDGTNNYVHQIAMTTNTNKLWHRLRNGASFGSWEEIKKGDITFASLTSKPTTISGYGITDAYTKTQSDGKYLLNTTDTLSGHLTVTGNLTVDGTTFGLYHGTVEDDYYFDSYNGSLHLNMFLKNARADIIRYAAIQNVEYWNGSSWQDGDSQIGNVKKLLDGRQDTSWAVPSTYYKFRFEIKPSTPWPLQAKIGQQLSWTGSLYPGSTITVEENTPQGTTPETYAWTTKVTADFGGIVDGSQTPLNSNNNGVTNWGTMFKADSALHTGNGTTTATNNGYNTRITVDYYGWSPSNSSYQTIPLQNLFITSNFSGLENTDYTNLLDYDRNITTSGDILPNTDNAHDLGSSSKEFKDGYFDGTVYLDGINLDGNTITGINDSDEFDDDDSHIMTSAGIDDRISTRISGLTSNAGTVTGTGADTRLAVWSSNSALTSDSTLLWRDDNATPTTKELYIGGRIIPTAGIKLDVSTSHSPSVKMISYGGNLTNIWQMYARSSSELVFQEGGDIVFSLTTNGNLTLDGTINATNFSGSSTGTNTGDQDISGIATNATAISNITSFPGFGTTSGTALEGDTTLFSGAYADLTGKPTLFDGAYSSLSGLPTLFDGAYSSLSGAPTIPSGNQIIDWTSDQGNTNIHTGNYNNTQLSDSEVIAAVVASTNISDSDKGTIRSNIGAGSSTFSGAYADLTGKPTIPSGNQIIDWTTDQGNTNIHANNYNNTQLSNSQVVAAVVASTSISNSDKSTFRSNIGAGTSSFDGAYGSLSDIPGSFTPASHTHAASDITSGTFANARISASSVTQHVTGITSAQSTKLGHISVTQAVDLDTIETNSSLGATAYGWGDHADEGYLTSFDITTQTDSKYIRSNANDNVTAHTEWQDNKQARFGNDADMKIQHTGTHGYIDNNTGDLYIRNNVNADVGGDIYIRPHDTEHGIIIFDDADVEIYHNNSKKFSTTSNGFECNGTEIDTSSNGGGYKIGFNVSDNFSFSGYDVAHYGISNAGNDTGGGIVLSGYFGIRFATNGSIRGHFSNTGTFTTSGDIVGFGSPSDISLKENIKPIDNALDKVCKLKGVTFDWKESDSILEIKEDIGFIAQDVQEVLPELIKENDNGKLSLRDKGIVPVLVEAIKELKAEIDELKKCNKCKNCNCND